MKKTKRANHRFVKLMQKVVDMVLVALPVILFDGFYLNIDAMSGETFICISYYTIFVRSCLVLS